MDGIGGAHVEAAVDEMLAVLTPLDLDWQVPAGTLDWSCWDTAAHVAHDLSAYAAQVAGRVTTRYLPFDLVVDASATPLELLSVVSAFGRMLSKSVAAAEGGPVAWHWGMSDASGFAAMGVAETLVHTHDITQGLGVTWRPPEELCDRVVDRLLTNPPDSDAWTALLWSTGRAELAGRAPVTSWVWRPAPR